jgi:hypothetical protein
VEEVFSDVLKKLLIEEDVHEMLDIFITPLYKNKTFMFPMFHIYIVQNPEKLYKAMRIKHTIFTI